MAIKAVGVSAGIALLFRRPAAVTLAIVALTADAAADLFVVLTSYFPSNRVPGDEPIHIAGILGYYGVWMTYLLRSKRVANTFGGR